MYIFSEQARWRGGEGNYVYTGSEGNEQLQFFSHPEGYVSAESGGYDYVYQYKDHLGNVRLSYTEDPSNPALRRLCLRSRILGAIGAKS